MKKAVKSLVIASSIAAIAGIGAVSFAKWSASTSAQHPTGSTGAVTTIGAVSVANNNLSGDGAKTLVPFDQDAASGYDSSSHALLWKMDVTATYSGDAPKLEISAAFDNASAHSATIGDAALYLYVGAQTITDANYATVVTNVASDTTNWKSIMSAQQIDPAATGTAKTIYIALVADNTKAMNEPMTLTIEAKAATTT